MAALKVASQRAGARPFTAKAYAPKRLGPVCRGQAGGDIRSSGMEKALFGENFGARDPTAGELATNFNEVSLGNWNTEHIIKPPDAIKKVVGLTARSCKDNEGSLALLDAVEVERLRQQVPGWRVAANSAGKQCIRQDWKAKDADTAPVLASKLADVGASEGHSANVHVSITGTDITVELSTVAVGGLSENDFIVAAKINELSVADLIAKKKQRFWA